MIADAEAMTDELRRIAHGILPPLLASEGLAAALRAETVHSAIGVRVVDDGVGRSEQDVELAVYLCCLEAIQNAAKHAGRGAAASVTLQRFAGELRFTVHDTGSGFDTEPRAPGAGLTNVRDRIETVGGRIDVVSAAGAGRPCRARSRGRRRRARSEPRDMRAPGPRSRRPPIARAAGGARWIRR